MAQRVGGPPWARLLAPLVSAWARSARRRPASSVRLPGLGGPVRVAFDGFDVPYIEAASDLDLFRAQGVVQALARGFQMDLLRHALSGRLAELLGDRPMGNALGTGGGSTVDADRFMRAMGLEVAATESERLAGPEHRPLIEAYVAGVNAVFCGPLGRPPSFEHRLLARRARPWRVVDSLLVAKGMALGLSFSWRVTPVLGALREALVDAPALLAALLPAAPSTSTGTIEAALPGFQGWMQHPAHGAVVRGSNALVVGPDRSRSGGALLASDPHLELGLPATWYLTSLRGPSYKAVGAALPGLPGIVLGRNEDLAWGLTNAMLDDGDVWVEDVDEKANRYRVDGEWRSLAMRTEAIRVRGRGQRAFRLRSTHRGPLWTDAFARHTGAPSSIRLVLHEPTPDLQSFLALARSASVGEGFRSVAAFGAPAQNIVLADRHGATAWRRMGLVPVRPPRPRGGLPLDGTTSANDWIGWVAEADAPRALFARDATFATANDATAGPTDVHGHGHLFEPAYRVGRLRERLRAPHLLDTNDMAAAQQDVQNDAFLRLRKHAIAPRVEEVRRTRPHLGPAIDRVMTWDGLESVDARGAPLAQLVYHHLVRHVFGPRLGTPLLERWMALLNLVDEPLQKAFEDPGSPWAPPERRAALVGRAFDDALRSLEQAGLALDAPWGAFHRLRFRHPLGSVPALAPLTDRGPLPAPGGPFTPCAGQFDHVVPGPMRAGASFRFVVDMAHPEEARMVLAGGQSGDPTSPHYDDQIPLWLQGRFIPMRLEPPAEPRRVLDMNP